MRYAQRPPCQRPRSKRRCSLGQSFPRVCAIGVPLLCQSAKPHCPTGVDERFASARVRLRRRPNDSPLIGERAATCGRIATDAGDEHAGAKSASSVRAPASRTGSHGGNLDALSFYPDWIEQCIPKSLHAEAIWVPPGKETQALVSVMDRLWAWNCLGIDLETGGEKELDGLDPISNTSKVTLMQIGNRGMIHVVQPALTWCFKDILQSDNILKINQNITFDFKWLLKKYGIHMVRMFCTMLAQQLLQAGMDGYSVSLQDLARTYPPHRLICKEVRNEFFQHTGVFSEEQIYYAARDVFLLFDIMSAQNAALKKHQLVDIAKIEFNIIAVTAEMELTGVCLNKEVMGLTSIIGSGANTSWNWRSRRTTTASSNGWVCATPPTATSRTSSRNWGTWISKASTWTPASRSYKLWSASESTPRTPSKRP
jgi:hypothetical protein